MPKRTKVSELRAEIASLRRVGSQLANVAFNLGQEGRGEVTLRREDKGLLRSLQREWDAVPRAVR